MFPIDAEEINCSFLDDEVDEIVDAESDLANDYSNVERELMTTDSFIDDELDEVITQADINMIQDELKYEYDAEIMSDKEVEGMDYSNEDDLLNPFDSKPKNTIEDYLNDF